MTGISWTPIGDSISNVNVFKSYISDTLTVRAFFEDLNSAADSGLYAKLIQNGSFEYSAADSPC